MKIDRASCQEQEANKTHMVKFMANRSVKNFRWIVNQLIDLAEEDGEMHEVEIGIPYGCIHLCIDPAEMIIRQHYDDEDTLCLTTDDEKLSVDAVMSFLDDLYTCDYCVDFPKIRRSDERLAKEGKDICDYCTRELLGKSKHITDTCAICHDPVEDRPWITLKCSHTYHVDCHHKWIDKKPTCPECREPVK